MFYKVVVAVWDIKHKRRREGTVFFFFKTCNTGGGGEAGGETDIKQKSS